MSTLGLWEKRFLQLHYSNTCYRHQSREIGKVSRTLLPLDYAIRIERWLPTWVKNTTFGQVHIIFSPAPVFETMILELRTFFNLAGRWTYQFLFLKTCLSRVSINEQCHVFNVGWFYVVCHTQFQTITVFRQICYLVHAQGSVDDTISLAFWCPNCYQKCSWAMMVKENQFLDDWIPIFLSIFVLGP